ncbi:MAG: hypothetical protein JJU18_11580 [Oceanicaulis sp.]|nr:hypothetical protein [Oceanicaulis sp.]
MIALQNFVTAVKSAVHQAAHIVREQNLQMVYRFFEEQEPHAPGPEPDTPPETPRPGLPQAGRGGRGGSQPPPPAPPAPEGPPVLRPRMVAFEYPVETEDGPAVHTAFAPLVSLTGIQALEIAEFRLTLKVLIAEDGETVSLAFPGSPQSGASGQGRRKRRSGDADEPAGPDPETGTIEIVLKSVDPPGGFYEIIRGYDRALRANIPG